MNHQYLGDNAYSYWPLTKAEVVMLLINHLKKGDGGVTIERAEEIVSENTPMIPCVTGGEKPQEVTTLKEVEGVILNCDLDREDIDLSSFTPQTRDEIIALLDSVKGKRHRGTMFLKERLEQSGVLAVTKCLIGFIAFTVSLSVYAMSSTVNKITWQYEYCDDGVKITGTTVPKGITEIIVPDKLGGSDVVEIGIGAVASQYAQSTMSEFYYTVVRDNDIVNLLKLPDHIKRICARAFYSRIIKYVEMPESLEVLDRHAFGCHAPAGTYMSGVYHSAGETPTGIHQIIFWGKKPQITNELQLSYLGTHLPSGKTDGDIMFKNAFTYVVAVGDAYIGLCDKSHPEMFADSHESNSAGDFYKFQGATLRPAYANVIMSCQRLKDAGIGNVVTLSAVNSVAQIYYTVDGSDPQTVETSNCFLYKEPIVINERTLIKAVAKVDSNQSFSWGGDVYTPNPYKFMYYSYSKIEKFDCFECTVITPEVVASAGQKFDHANNEISLSCPDDAVIRYTLDGSPVSESSPVYMGSFLISDTTTVRVRAYKTDWFPSEEVVQTFTRVWYTNETPVISAASTTFDTSSQEVAISCATEGATVYYTIDESEPSAANGRVYKGPFNIYDSVTVKAIAVKDDWKDSAVASAAFTKNNGLSAAINMYDYLPDNDANCPWTVDAAVSHDGVSSVRSGMLSADGGTTTMKVTVKGAGKLSFWWKAECEEECDGEYYDYGAFRIGTADPLAYIAGDSGWQRFETEIVSTGKHFLKWEYHKDDAESIPRDCIWVDQVQWVPADDSGHTLTTGVPVPYSWLESYGFGVETDFEAAAKMKFGKVDGAGRAMSVEDDYVAGTDPTNLESKLTATIKMGTDGRPILSWKPPLNGETEEGAGIREGVRRYSVLGKRDLGDVEEEWAPVAEGDESGYRFFKVKANMP